MLNQKGYTLLELLIAVTILAVITAIAFPSFSNSHVAVFSQATNDQIAILLQEASQLALATGRNTLVEFTANSVMVWSAKGVEETLTLDKVVLSTNIPGETLVFDKKGKPILGGLSEGIITVVGDGFGFQIKIYPDGRIIGGGSII